MTYRATEPTRAHASDYPLRQQLIDEGLLRPDRNERLAPTAWHRLTPMRLPAGTVVLRIDDLSRARAERAARS